MLDAKLCNTRYGKTRYILLQPGHTAFRESLRQLYNKFYTILSIGFTGAPDRREQPKAIQPDT